MPADLYKFNFAGELFKKHANILGDMQKMPISNKPENA